MDIMAGLLAMTDVLAKAKSSDIYVPDMWATVTSLSPLQVILDNDINQTPRDVTSNAVGLITPNLRVTVEYRGTDLIIKQAPRKPIRIPVNANLDNYTVPGDYYCPVSADVATFTNSPPGNQAGALEVMQASGVIQYWHEYNTGITDGNVYKRRYYEPANSWSAWQLYQGPALFDFGSNGNGSWARFPASGLQICWMRQSRTDIAINSSYSPAWTGLYVWTYPRPFTSDPAVTCSEFKWGTSASWPSVANATQTYAELRVHDFYQRSTGTSTAISAMAIGLSS